MDPATAYFLKKYYPHVIKWWLVMYNPEVVRIWPPRLKKEEALRLEAEEAKVLAIEGNTQSVGNSPTDTTNTGSIDASAFNATTGSYSGLYGQDLSTRTQRLPLMQFCMQPAAKAP